MLRANGITPVCATDDLYSSPYADVVHSLKTHYERQWIDRGLTIKYLQFALPRNGVLMEPEVEIERDTYRSYGRGTI